MNVWAIVATTISKPIRSIRVRLTLWYVALLTLVILVFSAFLYVRLAQNLHAETDRALTLEAQQIGGSPDMDRGSSAPHIALDRIPSGMVIRLYDPTGTQYKAGTPGAVPSLPLPAGARALRSPVLQTDRLASGSWRVLTTPIRKHGQVVGLLQVAQPEDQTEAALRQLALLMGFGVPLTIVLASAGGLFLAGRALDPIDRITRTAQRIGVADLSQRLGMLASDDEIGRLAATFDGMLDRLDRAFQRERQFTADASHELRTPLAVLAAQAEVALERERRPAQYRQALTAIHGEAQRLSRLLSQLLTLARADAGHDDLEREPLDLTAVVTDTVLTLLPLAEASNVLLSVCGSQPAWVLGDQTRLTQLVVNLVDNAVTYTPAGGSVRVAVKVAGGQALLCVRDSGVGIAPEHLPHVFERFYRVDAARERSDGGAGLGLAIADWIATVHGGRIGVESVVRSGTTFRVTLPLSGGKRIVGSDT